MRCLLGLCDLHEQGLQIAGSSAEGINRDPVVNKRL